MSAAFRFALAVTPLVARTVGPLLMRRPALYHCTARFDESLRTILHTLMYARIPWTPELVIDAPDDLQETIAREGALFVSAHFPLNVLTTRWLYDQGIAITTVRAGAEPEPLIWGTRAHTTTIFRSPNLFVQIRSRLAAKGVVLMLVDNARDHEHPIDVETALGTLRVSPATFAFAKRAGVPLFFTCVRVDEAGRARQIVRRLAPDVQDYIRVLKEQTAAVRQ